MRIDELPSHRMNIFINREEEKETFSPLLDLNQTGVTKKIFEITAIAGQGKTELALEICHKAKAKNIKVAYIDLEDEKYQTIWILPVIESLYPLILDSQKQNDMLKLFDSFWKEYESFRKVLSANPSEADRSKVNEFEDKIIDEFVKNLKGVLDKERIVICLDTIEKAYAGILEELEEKIFKHVIKYKNFFLIITGQKKHKWETRDMSMQVSSISLKPLKRQHAQEFIEKLTQRNNIIVNKDTEDYLFEIIWNLTSGHPYCCYKLLDFLTENNKQLNKDKIDDNVPGAVESLVENFINEGLENWKNKDKYPDPEKILLYLSVLRKIEFGNFHYIITKFMESYFIDKSTYYMQTLMNEILNQTYLFVRNGDFGGYDMEKTPRNILLSHLRLNYHSLYVEIQEFLTEKYEMWIQTSTDVSLIKNIIEHIYHFVMLSKEKKINNIDDEIQNKLKYYLKNYIKKGGSEEGDDESDILFTEQCNRLKNALENDDELKEIIDIEALIKIVDNYMKNHTSDNS